MSATSAKFEEIEFFRFPPKISEFAPVFPQVNDRKMSRRSLQPGNSQENVLLSSLDRLNGLETAAVAVLKQAVEMDNSRRYLEALTCYREGLGILMDVVRSESSFFNFSILL